MADRQDRWEDNVPGPWYVDRSCILCSLCSEIAPESFRESDTGDHDVVFCQPASGNQVAQAGEALAQCPVGAIGQES
jgi:ferredoxin